jgi:hypothetical protein
MRLQQGFVSGGTGLGHHFAQQQIATAEVGSGSFSTDPAGFANWSMSASLQKRPNYRAAAKWREVPEAVVSRCSKSSSLDHVVGAKQERVWDR